MERPEPEICAECGVLKVAGVCGGKTVLVYEPFYPGEEGHGDSIYRRLSRLRRIASALACEEKRILRLIARQDS